MIGYQWTNVAAMLWPVSIPNECSSLTAIHSSPQDLRGLKLLKFRNFHYFKKWTKPIYFDIDVLWQLLDPSGHPLRASLTLSKHPFNLFFFSLLCLTTGHSMSLAHTFSLTLVQQLQYLRTKCWKMEVSSRYLAVIPQRPINPFVRLMTKMSNLIKRLK